jgi:hypothetical protein
MKRLDEFFAHEEIQPSVRYPSPGNSDETVIMVSQLSLLV